MSSVCEKLVVLALASENVDEACAALRKARKVQPDGKLQAILSPDWAAYHNERDALLADRDAFEEERREFQRAIFGSQKRKITWRGSVRAGSAGLFKLRYPAAVFVFAGSFLASGANRSGPEHGEILSAALAVVGLN